MFQRISSRWFLTLYLEAFTVKLMPKHSGVSKAGLWDGWLWRAVWLVRPCAVGNAVTGLASSLWSGTFLMLEATQGSLLRPAEWLHRGLVLSSGSTAMSRSCTSGQWRPTTCTARPKPSLVTQWLPKKVLLRTGWTTLWTSATMCSVRTPTSRCCCF